MTGPPREARLAASRASLPEAGRSAVVGFTAAATSPDESGGGEEPASALPRAWSEGRHLIVRCGGTIGLADAVGRLTSAGVSAETPALAASGLGTGRERLLYGSLGDVGSAGFAGQAVLVVPHPAALPVDFAWPPTAAP